jgi:hypothetical protein
MSIAGLLVMFNIVASISARTVQRWLKADKLKPWRFRSWITPKDPVTFLARACPVLDLYQRVVEGRLARDEIALSIDEKTSIQARHHDTYTTAGQGEPAHLENTYSRRGALTLIAALDVATGAVAGELYCTKHFAAFAEFLRVEVQAAVDAGMRHIHLILDNGSTHRPKYLAMWLAENFPGLDVQIHWLPVRSSWLNQVEIFFGLLQREALTPNNFANLDELKFRIRGYINYRTAKHQPINWTYTSEKLRKKYEKKDAAAAAAAAA